MQSIRLMKERLECAPAIRELIPDEVSTIHRLLGSKGSSVRFRYSGDNPLPFDAVIIDEASMVALPLMAKLAVALRHDARLILLGDRDQLASVEAGAVLGDICGGGRNEPFSPEFADLVARVAGERIPAEPSAGAFPTLTDSLVVLKRNYRFGADSGIGEVGRAVNAGDGEGAIALLKGESCRDMAWRSVPKPDGLRKALSGTVVAGYGAYLAAGSPAEALERFDAFRVLCALRQGPYGVAGINAIVEDILAGKGLIDPHSRWYRGRPVMITVKSTRILLIVSVVLLCLIPALAADISGKWTTVITTGIGAMNYTFDFKAEGEKLTGKAVMSMEGNSSESALTEGSVKGNDISFVETLKVQGQELRCEYKGKISGDEIRGSRQVGSYGTEEFVAKRAK